LDKKKFGGVEKSPSEVTDTIVTVVFQDRETLFQLRVGGIPTKHREENAADLVVGTVHFLEILDHLGTASCESISHRAIHEREYLRDGSVE
jgi:hypothetical protein